MFIAQLGVSYTGLHRAVFGSSVAFIQAFNVLKYLSILPYIYVWWTLLSLRLHMHQHIKGLGHM